MKKMHLIAVIAFLTYFSCTNFADEPTSAPAVSNVPLISISDAIKSRNLVALQKHGDKIAERLADKFNQPDAEVLSQICSVLSAYDFGGGQNTLPNLDALRDQYAMVILRAITKNDEKPSLQFEFRQLLNLSVKAAKSTESFKTQDALVQYRQEETEMWLRAWKRLRAEMDPQFDPSKMLPSPPTVPGGGYPPGIAPQEIRDPNIRKLYETQLAEYNTLLKKIVEQNELTRFKRQYMWSFQRFLVSAYQCTPKDFDTLALILKELNDEELTKGVTALWEKKNALLGAGNSSATQP